MLKRHSNGFTIVELFVVVIVVATIASISVVAYSQLQAESRDNKRETDMIIVMNELEKFYDRKGEYPPGCPETSCTSAMHTANTSTSPLTSTTSLTAVMSVLPGVKSTFGDPQSLNVTLPFKHRTVNERKYLYFGGTFNNSTTSATLDVTTNTNFPCTLRSTLAAGTYGSYIIGYYSEQNQKWVLKGGRSGTAMTIASGTTADGCVINRG